MLLNALIILLAITVLASVARNVINDKNENSNVRAFMGKDSTNALKGFAIIMIALAHICQYDESFSGILIGGRVAYTVLFSWGAIGVSLFFLLSGYGCFLSLNKTDKYGKWLVKHIIKMLIHFVIVFIPIICVLRFVFNLDVQPIEYLIHFITLRLPGSTVWYFKIQILFYIILAISMRISKKNACIIVGGLSLCYALIANFVLGLPDYWWKTSLCFMTGCFVAKYRESIQNLMHRSIMNIGVLVAGCLSYYIILKDYHFTFVIQIISYMVLAFCITMVWDWAVRGNRVLQKMGQYSLDTYLIHIGLVECVFLMDYDLNAKIIIFIVSVTVMTVLCYQISELLNKKTQRILK